MRKDGANRKAADVKNTGHISHPKFKNPEALDAFMRAYTREDIARELQSAQWRMGQAITGQIEFVGKGYYPAAHAVETARAYAAISEGLKLLLQTHSDLAAMEATP